MEYVLVFLYTHRTSLLKITDYIQQQENLQNNVSLIFIKHSKFESNTTHEWLSQNQIWK